MGLLNVIAAGAAAWVFGAIWYTIMAKPWMKATGLTEEQVEFFRMTGSPPPGARVD